MFLLNNDFDPEVVVQEIQNRQDLPEIDFIIVYHFLNNWIKEWYEGSIEEDDVLIDLIFGNLSLENVVSIQVIPHYWRTLRLEFEEGVITPVGFPIILVEYCQCPLL